MSDLALHRTQSELEHAHERFNALAQVAGRALHRWVHPAFIPPLAAVSGGLAGANAARFGTKGAVANAVVAAVGWGAAIFSGENADLRNVAIGISSGLGGGGAAILAYDKVTSMMAATPAPPAAAAA